MKVFVGFCMCEKVRPPDPPRPPRMGKSRLLTTDRKSRLWTTDRKSGQLTPGDRRGQDDREQRSRRRQVGSSQLRGQAIPLVCPTLHVCPSLLSVQRYMSVHPSCLSIPHVCPSLMSVHPSCLSNATCLSITHVCPTLQCNSYNVSLHVGCFH